MWLVPALAMMVLAQGKALYPSSVVGTDFDFIVDADPDVFDQIVAKGEGRAEMPDKRDSKRELRQPAFLFEILFRDHTKVSVAVDCAFESAEAALEEVRRYAPRLGKLPSTLRQGVRRLVVHRGGEDTTAFSDIGLVVVYSDNATKRIGTHDLEETLFHESVHAAWDHLHRASDAWREAQRKDGRFVTDYARKNPDTEDLAESALFAFTLIHHPERIRKSDAEKIRRAIPARIAFVETLVPKDRPLHYVTCQLDLTRVGPLRDVLSNALNVGLRRDEARVREWLDGAGRGLRDADSLLAAAAKYFGVDERDLRAQVETFRHCNCTHAEVGTPVSAAK